MKSKKVGMSFINWLLCIIGILVFLSFIILPPIFRSVLSDDQEGSTTTPTASVKPEKDSKASVITCTKKDTGMDTNYIIHTADDKIEMFAQTLTYHYSTIDSATTDFCSNENVAYQGINGFLYNCRIEENDMIIDLRVNTSEYTEGYIPVSYDLTESANTVKTSLLNDGFACQEKEEE